MRENKAWRAATCLGRTTCVSGSTVFSCTGSELKISGSTARTGAFAASIAAPKSSALCSVGLCVLHGTLGLPEVSPPEVSSGCDAWVHVCTRVCGATLPVSDPTPAPPILILSTFVYVSAHHENVTRKRKYTCSPSRWGDINPISLMPQCCAASPGSKVRREPRGTDLDTLQKNKNKSITDHANPEGNGPQRSKERGRRGSTGPPQPEQQRQKHHLLLHNFL